MDEGLAEAYSRLISAGKLQSDGEQEQAVGTLDTLYEELKVAKQFSLRKASLLSRLRFRSHPSVPKGIYLFGGVGRGKTMLMDLFYQVAPVDLKLRVHFHLFMQETHRWMHKWRTKGATHVSIGDPIPALAQDLKLRAHLLCLDEFEIRDVADAMIMRRLFTALWRENIVVIMTSNWSPDDLYSGGLQRELFLPFISLLKQQIHIIDLGSKIDYRFQILQRKQVYFCPTGESQPFDMSTVFRELVGNVASTEEILLVNGREIKVPRVNQGIVWYTFEELCEKALGAGDYLALAKKYHTLLLANIPAIASENRDVAKRFVTLIDILYENNVKLVCNAAVPPEELYANKAGVPEFARAVSRLNEMQSVSYLSREHGNKVG